MVADQRAIVFGSLNMDLAAYAPRLPAPGETVRADSLAVTPGGKGANQAVAIARAGLPVLMVGAVGDDAYGRDLQAALRDRGVDASGIRATEGPTGLALIAVDAAGENQIVIVPGSNDRLDGRDLERLATALPSASLLVLQLEISLELVTAAAIAAREAGVPVLLDPAPARALPPDLYAAVDILTPNAPEAEQLSGIAVRDRASAERAARVLRERGPDTVIVTLGAAGALCVAPEETVFVPAFAVETVDTVAAGDAFNGALAVVIARGRPLREAVEWGAAAGALAAARLGAQASLPAATEVRSLLETSHRSRRAD